jgi:hypothetical protein
VQAVCRLEVLNRAKLRRISDNCASVDGFSAVKSAPLRHLFAMVAQPAMVVKRLLYGRAEYS